MPFLKGAILVLSCCKEKYEKLRFEYWEKALSKLAYKMPIYYLFGQSENEGKIPVHPNVFKLVATCNDNYEDIPLKMYDGYRLLSVLDYDYIIKLDDNAFIKDVNRFIEIIEEEIMEHDYIALKTIIHDNYTDKEISKTHIQLSYYHINNVTDKRLSFVPTILFLIPFAHGPAYVLSKKAYSLLTKETFIKNLLEDNAIGYTLNMNDIHVFKSKVVDEKLIEDIDLHEDTGHLDIIMKSKRHILMVQKQAEKVAVSNKCLVHVVGGLGNQLFTIASGLAHCYKNNLVLKLYPTPNKRHYYWNSILSPFKKYVVNEDDPSLQSYLEPTMAYNEIPKDKMRLFGYFQSSKYFKNVQTIIKNCIVFPDPERLERTLFEKCGYITSNHIIVHARRGDYIALADYHNPQPDKYYEDGLVEIKKRIDKPVFILLSDDKDYWANSNVFKDENYVIIDVDEITTFFLMTRCKNFIIANSTFSWWGAYLANPTIVIAPKQWFGPKGPQDWQDIYEDEWILV
jgi:hypothetical protein